MSSQVLAESLTSEVTCPICLEFYTDPVRLDCEHNFCRLCLDQHRQQRGEEEDEDKKDFTCPQCRETFPPHTQPKSNRLLATIVERVRSLRVHPAGEMQCCPKHEERLKLYCENDQEPLCVVCGVSKDHKGHDVTPLHEATPLIKAALERNLQQLEARRESIMDAHGRQQKTAEDLQSLAASLRENVQSEYQKLQRFLHEEEGNLLEKLRAEEWRILQEMENNLGVLIQEKTILEQEIQRVQDSLATPDSATWLKVAAELKSRWTKGLQECGVLSQSLDVGKYRGPLQYMAWKKMWTLIDPGERWKFYLVAVSTHAEVAKRIKMPAAKNMSLCAQRFSGNNKNVKVTLAIKVPAGERSDFYLVAVSTHTKVAQRIKMPAAKNMSSVSIGF